MQGTQDNEKSIMKCFNMFHNYHHLIGKLLEVILLIEVDLALPLLYTDRRFVATNDCGLLLSGG
jgi:hypothetical protein